MKKESRISIYWQDIKVYRKGEAKTLPQMLTEGLLVKETRDYFYIKDPETISLDKIRNHPQKKPRLYYIPKSLVTEIIRYEK